MDQETAPAPRRRLDARGRVLRRGRIFARLRDGWAYDDIAREERLTAERVRQIVTEALRRRTVDDGSDHAKLQLARLAPAMRRLGDAVAGGDVKAVAPLLKVLNQFDRYQKVASANQVYDDEAREKLLNKINRIAANLSSDEPAKEAAPGGEAQAGDEARERAVAGEIGKTAWGVAVSP